MPGRWRSADQPPPSEATVDGWCSALLARPDALTYLLETRGLTLETIKRYELGYDSERNAITFPARDADGALLLVAGEIDALTGRQNDLPTVTTTCGTALPDHLAQRLAGRKVFVMYDV